MKFDWKIYLLIAGILVFGVFAIFLQKVMVFIMFILLTCSIALFVRFVPVLKYIGVEFITLSTIFIGFIYGPVTGVVYGTAFLLAHLLIGDYYIGVYLVWLLPEYALLGFLSGVFSSSISSLSLFLIVGMNALNLILTGFLEGDRLGKHLPYVVGNIVINCAIMILFFDSVIKIIG